MSYPRIDFDLPAGNGPWIVAELLSIFVSLFDE